MGTKISSLSLKVESIGLTDAAKSMKDLAEASKSVDKETREFINNQAKIAAATKPANSSMKEQSTSLVVQKRDMDIYNMSAKAYAAAQAEAIKMNKALDNAQKQIDLQRQAIDMMKLTKASKEYAAAQAEAIKMNKALDAAEKSRNLIQQKRDLEMYNAAAKENAKNLANQERALKSVNSSGSIWNNTLKSMAVAASAYIGVNFLKGIVEQADAWSMLEAKLKLATESTNNAKVVQQDLFELAQKLRIPLEDAGKLYTRLADPMRKAGKDSKETMSVVSGLSLALKLGGATAQEASSAMLQFSQAMNSGRLNGGEFNSMAENAPLILKAVEAQLRRTGQWTDMTTESLKKMGSEGKIGVTLIAESVQAMEAEWQKQFDTLPLTVDGALTRVKNAWFKAMGEMGQETGMGKALSDAILILEKMIPTIKDKMVQAFIGVMQWIDKNKEGLKQMGDQLSGLIGQVADLAGAAANTATGFSLIGFAIYSIRLGIAGVTDGVKLITAAFLGMGSVIMTALSMPFKLIFEVAEKLAKYVADTFTNLATAAKASGFDDVAAGLKNASSEALKLASSAKTMSTAISDYSGEAGAIAMNIVEDFKNGNTEVQKLLQGTDEVSKAIAEKGKYEESKDLERNKRLTRARELALANEKAIKSAQNDFEKAEKEKADAIEKSNIKIQTQIDKLSYLKKVGDDSKYTETQKERVALEVQLEKYEGRKLTRADALRKSTLETLIVQNKVLQAREAETKLFEDSLAINKRAEEAAEKSLKSSEEELFKQQNLYEAYGKTEEALNALSEVRLASNIQKQNELLLDAVTVANNLEEVKSINAVIAAQTKELANRREIASYKSRITSLNNEAAEAKKYEDAFQAANKKIADGLYNAIGKSGESAIKRLIRDIKESFARLVLSPFINPISQLGASIVSPNASSALSAGGLLGNIASTGKALWESFAGASSAFGSTGFMASMAGGLQGAGVGSGLTSSIGLQIGNAVQSGLTSVFGTAGTSIAGAMSSAVSAISTVAPYVAAIYTLYKGLSMGDKQMTGQTVEGNLGSNNLTRNVAWTQSGGFLRKDRSGVWDYNLANSSTMRDGVTYTDNANLANDKALLNQLNSAYDAIKKSTSDLATSLGLDAASIKSRVDKISFAFGKTADETAANINKMLETVGNNIAGDLLGSLKELAIQGESSFQTLNRLSVDLTTVNYAFKNLGKTLFETNVSGIKAAETLISLMGGLDSFKSITANYYKNFYTEEEQSKALLEELTKQFALMNVALPESRLAYKALVKETTDPEKLAQLLKLSDAFASVFKDVAEVISDADKLAAKMKPLEDAKEALKTLGEEASSWLDLRKRAADLKDAVDSALGGAKDPSKRIAELWKMMSQDVTLDQKVALAGELKDLVLQKYQVEKENFTKLLEYGKQLRNYVDGLKVGGLSPLTMTQKLAEAQKQYQETLAAAQGGDVTAQGQLQSKAETFLQLAQTAYASSGAYTDIFTSVTQALDALGVESISTADKANQIATDQYAELQKLSNYLGNTQDLAQTYYDQSLNKMQAQVDAIQTLAGKLGVLEGITSFLKDLPAEIAATLSARSGNGEFVAGLYSSIAGKSGSQIDQEGMDYWTSQAAMYGRQYTEDSFKSAVALMGNKAPVTTTPIDSATLSAQVEVLTTAVNELKETSIMNTSALINATVNSNVVSAEAIVEGTSDAIASAMFKSQNGVELV